MENYIVIFFEQFKIFTMTLRIGTLIWKIELFSPLNSVESHQQTCHNFLTVAFFNWIITRVGWLILVKKIQRASYASDCHRSLRLFAATSLTMPFADVDSDQAQLHLLLTWHSPARIWSLHSNLKHWTIFPPGFSRKTSTNMS